MATQNLIQRLDSANKETMNRAQYEYFLATSAITAGQTVSLDAAKTDSDRALYVLPADVDAADTSFPVGIAFGAAAAGEKVKVCIGGYFEGADVSGTTAKGSLLQIGSTAGRLEVRTTAVNEGGAATFNLLPIVALALEADTANKADVYIINSFC
tara:strand:+ start:1417 stop:1881 length:465 start_codon:yes stop_codon:yes gene_type:complete